jgi:hypothetical protein
MYGHLLDVYFILCVIVSENNFVKISIEILKIDGFGSEARKYYLGQIFCSNSN